MYRFSICMTSFQNVIILIIGSYTLMHLHIEIIHFFLHVYFVYKNISNHLIWFLFELEHNIA